MKPALAAVALASLLAFAGCGGSSGSHPQARGTLSAPLAMSLAQLRALPAQVGHKVYWAGPRRGAIYEVRRTSTGSVYVRYLRRGAVLGTPSSNYLTVGTYSVANAYGQVQHAKSEPGVRVLHPRSGGLAVVRPAHPDSVYLAFRDAPLLVEVYDPSPKRAQRLVENGSVRPIG